MASTTVNCSASCFSLERRVGYCHLATILQSYGVPRNFFNKNIDKNHKFMTWKKCALEGRGINRKAPEKCVKHPVLKHVFRIANL